MEIDIIELLKRIKEGNAPKKIEMNGDTYEYNEEWDDIYNTYETDNWTLYEQNIDFNTKIKILDKPILEELNPRECYFKDGTELVHKKMYDKINEIIRRINKGE